MRVSFNPSALRRTQLHEYAMRFLFGGLITVAAGLIAKEFGPVVGGLFLAFPAIFPASATLVDKHERQKKMRAGIKDTQRGRRAAGLDAFGAAQATIGLAVFAIVVWYALPRHSPELILAISTAVWFVVSVTIWYVQKSMRWSC